MNCGYSNGCLTIQEELYEKHDQQFFHHLLSLHIKKFFLKQ